MNENKWHIIHAFDRGYGWAKKENETEYRIWLVDIEKYLPDLYADFHEKTKHDYYATLSEKPRLMSEQELNEMFDKVSPLAEAWEEQVFEALKNRKPNKFSKYAIPLIKQIYPHLPKEPNLVSKKDCENAEKTF